MLTIKKSKSKKNVSRKSRVSKKKLGKKALTRKNMRGGSAKVRVSGLGSGYSKLVRNSGSGVSVRVPDSSARKARRNWEKAGEVVTMKRVVQKLGPNLKWGKQGPNPNIPPQILRTDSQKNRYAVNPNITATPYEKIYTSPLYGNGPKINNPYAVNPNVTAKPYKQIYTSPLYGNGVNTKSNYYSTVAENNEFAPYATARVNKTQGRSNPYQVPTKISHTESLYANVNNLVEKNTYQSSNPSKNYYFMNEKNKKPEYAMANSYENSDENPYANLDIPSPTQN